jgi:hypothetical protein
MTHEKHADEIWLEEVRANAQAKAKREKELAALLAKGIIINDLRIKDS